MPPKKAAATSSILAPIDPNQGNEALIREARNKKKKAISLPPREEYLDEEISNLEPSTSKWRIARKNASSFRALKKD
jgi:hypothetical protein